MNICIKLLEYNKLEFKDIQRGGHYFYYCSTCDDIAEVEVNSFNKDHGPQYLSFMIRIGHSCEKIHYSEIRVEAETLHLTKESCQKEVINIHLKSLEYAFSFLEKQVRVQEFKYDIKHSYLELKNKYNYQLDESVIAEIEKYFFILGDILIDKNVVCLRFIRNFLRKLGIK